MHCLCSPRWHAIYLGACVFKRVYLVVLSLLLGEKKCFLDLTSATFAPHVCFAFTVQSIRAHVHPADVDLPQGKINPKGGLKGLELFVLESVWGGHSLCRSSVNQWIYVLRSCDKSVCWYLTSDFILMVLNSKEQWRKRKVFANVIKFVSCFIFT